MEQQPEPARTLPPADAPVRRPGEFDVADPAPEPLGLPPAPSDPAGAGGAGGSKWRLGGVLAIAALLLVGAGVFVQQRRSSDDGTSVLGTSIEQTTTTAVSPLETTPPPATTTTLGTTTSLDTATTLPGGTSPSGGPPTPPTAHPGAAPSSQVSGVVRVTWLVAESAMAADPTTRPPATCGEVTGEHQVRISGGPSDGVVTLTDRGEAFRGQFGGIARVVCDYTYVAELDPGSSALTFELVTPDGQVADSRQVAAEDVRAGIGPFLGHLIAAG